jgi:hypothetical protein
VSVGRISLQQGFERLLPHYNGWTVCEMLTSGLYKNHIRLWRNGVLLSPTDLRDEGLHVRAEIAPDGRWLCTIVGCPQPMRVQIVEVNDDDEVQTAKVILPPPPVWEVDAEGIEALLPPLRKGGTRKRTRQPKWSVLAEREIQRLCHIGSPLLENFSALYDHIEDHVTSEGGRVPKNKSRFRKEIRTLAWVH